MVGQADDTAAPASRTMAMGIVGAALAVGVIVGFLLGTADGINVGDIVGFLLGIGLLVGDIVGLLLGL